MSPPPAPVKKGPEILLTEVNDDNLSVTKDVNKEENNSVSRSPIVKMPKKSKSVIKKHSRIHSGRKGSKSPKQQRKIIKK